MASALGQGVASWELGMARGGEPGVLPVMNRESFSARQRWRLCFWEPLPGSSGFGVEALTGESGRDTRRGELAFHHTLLPSDPRRLLCTLRATLEEVRAVWACL